MYVSNFTLIMKTMKTSKTLSNLFGKSIAKNRKKYRTTNYWRGEEKHLYEKQLFYEIGGFLQ